MSVRHHKETLKENIYGGSGQVKLYKVAARPTHVYGRETWVTTKRSRITAAEMRFLRGVNVIDWKK